MELSGQVAASPLKALENENCFKTKDVPGKQKFATIAGGWKIMPFIIGNEACANLALASLSVNLVVFLTGEYRMDRLRAAKISTIWSGINSLSPIVGAFIADSYLGRFWAIVLASIAYVMALSLLTLISFLLHVLRESSIGLGLLCIILGLMVLGSSGMKSSALPFGAEQFDSEDEEGRKQQQSFFNWYYCVGTASVMMGLTFLVYLQSSVSWKLGFSVATLLVIISTGLFMLGTDHYAKVCPEGSALTEYAQVIVASIKKRSLAMPCDARELYDTSLDKEGVPKLCLTDKIKFLNKAAIVREEDFKENASTPDPWTLSTVEKIEELKSVISVLPVWSSGIVAAIILVGPAHTYMTYQAQHMNSKIGNLNIPPASYNVFTLLTISLWLPFYDRVVLPFFRRLTKRSEGIALRERIGTGLIISILAMAVAALVEVMRKQSRVVISGFWLAPQYSLIGLAETFYAVGLIEFFYEQFPKSMKSTAVALFWCSVGIGLLLSSIVMTVVHKATGENGDQAWLPQDLGRGHLEYYYCFSAGLGVVNFLYYYLVCMRGVTYRDGLEEDDDKNESGKLEISAESFYFSK